MQTGAIWGIAAGIIWNLGVMNQIVVCIRNADSSHGCFRAHPCYVLWRWNMLGAWAQAMC